MDGTLCNEVCYTVKEIQKATPNKKMVEFCDKHFREDFVVIYTARVDELIPATLEWLRRNNVRYHAISNLKIPASVYFDDKARKA